MNIGVIVDHNSVTRWQALALMDASPGNRVIVYNCTNSRSQIRWLRHPAYYALNLITLRNSWTRRQALPSAIAIHATRNFECIMRDSWQSLPTALLHQISSDQVDVIVKFGMGLLRVPDAADLSVPILSYHHGNPRGRIVGANCCVEENRERGEYANQSGKAKATHSDLAKRESNRWQADGHRSCRPQFGR